MTVTALDARDEYTAASGQTIFNYTFKIYAASELDVYITPVGQSANDSTDLTTAYTVDVSSIGDPAGGFITLDNGTNSGDLVTIVSGIPYNRTVDYQGSGDFLPDTVDGDNDRQVSQIKQVADLSARGLSFPVSAQNASDLSLPTPVAGLHVRWKQDLTGLENVGVGDAASDASLISYTSSAPSSIQRTVQSRLTDFITPKDYAAVGDGVTDDSTAFTTLEANNTGLTIDMLGLTYFVSSLPSNNRYTNGYFLLTNLDETAPVRVPANDTLNRHLLQIDTGNRYSAWPQDSCSSFNGQLLISYNEGTDHTNADQHVVMATSVDGGKSITKREQPFVSSLGQRVSFSGMNAWGQDLKVVQATDTGIYRLYGRRRYEVIETTDTLESIEFSTTFTLRLLTIAGMKEGDRIRITGSDPVGGVDCNGTHTITNISNSVASLFVPGLAATSTETGGGGTFRVEFLQDDFTEIQIGGVTMGSSIVTSDPDLSAVPTLLHSMALDTSAISSNDYAVIYVGYHINGIGPKIAKFDEIFQGASSAIVYTKLISSSLAEGIEPTVVYDDVNDDIMGFIRSAGAGYPVRFWHSTDDLATDATLVDSPWGDNFGTDSPVPCRVIGDELHFCLTGERERDGLAGKVGLYWGRVPLTSLPADVWTDCTLVKIKELYFSNTNATDSTNAVGVPSMAVIDDNTLSFIYSTERSPLTDDFDGQPTIECMTVKIDGINAFSAFDDGSAIETFTEKTELLDVNRIVSASTFAFSGDFESNGTTVISNGLTVTEDNTGLYSAIFTDDKGVAMSLPSDDFLVFIQPSAPAASGDAWIPAVTTQLASGFSYEMTNVSAGALNSQPHFIGVIWIKDWARTEWR